jgi:hypothetical protein
MTIRWSASMAALLSPIACDPGSGATGSSGNFVAADKSDEIPGSRRELLAVEPALAADFRPSTGDGPR